MKIIPIYKKYKNKRPKFSKYLTPFFSLHILDVKGDTAVTAWRNGSGQYYNVRNNKIHYRNNGRAYIDKGNNYWYLDEMMRNI